MRSICTLSVLGVCLFLVSIAAQCQRVILSEEIEYEDDKVSLKNLVDDLVKPYLTEHPKGALVIGLLNDTTKAVISYGQLSHTTEQKPDKHTLFEIGSATKPFTALLAIALEQEGKLNLNESISTYLPDSLNNPHLQQITVNDLIAHQSGLPKTPINLNITKTNPNNPYEHYTNQHLLEYLQVFKPLKPTRKRIFKRKKKHAFRYSDTAYGVLGLILEQVSGKNYAQLLNHYIFKPLDINYTCLSKQELKQALALPYTFNKTPTSNYTYQSNMQASTGLYSCASDLLTFLDAQMPQSKLNGNELALSLQKSHIALASSNMKRIDISAGWYKVNQGKKYPPLFVSNGGTGGYFTYMAFNKVNRTGVVLLSNSTNRIDHIGIELLNILSQKSE